MYRPAPDFDSFDCRASAALLRSMGSVEWASHVGALLAISLHIWFPLLLWGLVLYLAVRVRLDAELLDMLADDPERLDLWLARAGLRRGGGKRSIEDRCKGARGLACYLVLVVVLQFAVTAVVLWWSSR